MTQPLVRETGLSGLLDTLAIRSLVDAYASAVDNGDGEAFAELFEPDGVIERGAASEVSPARVHRGRAELTPIPGNLAGKYDRTFHFVGNHASTIDGDTAAGVTYCLAHHLNIDRHGSIDHVMFIRYLDDVRRGSDGRWRFSKRKLVVEWTETRLADPKLPA